MNKHKKHQWTNYEFQPSFVLGFHGCDEAVGEDILRGGTPHLNLSTNRYDWLGAGIYFWEGNPARALAFAEERAKGAVNSKGSITNPFVLGAVINLKRCLDLADSSAINEVHQTYEALKKVMVPKSMPSNGKALKARFLDCLVINTLHNVRFEEGLEPYDSVRGLFWEGRRIYPYAGIRQYNHIQICVRNPECILGYFRPIQS